MKQDHNLRIRPRDDAFLDRKRGIAGEIFFDKSSNSLRCYDGGTPGGFELARTDLENVPTDSLNEKLASSNAVVTTGAYENPSWIVSIDASKITGLNTGGGGDGDNGGGDPGVPANIVLTSDVGTVTNTMLAGSIANNKLLNSSLTIGTTAISLGSSSTTLTGLTSVTSTNFAGSLTGTVTGNAGSATVLQTARLINGVSFNGSADITVTAAAGTLTGTTLKSTVVNSSLTSVGTLNTLTVNGLVTANDEITAVGDITTDSNVVVAQSPSLTTHATNKQYVDARSVAMAVALS